MVNPLLPLLFSALLSRSGLPAERCELSPELAAEIDGYGPVVRRILSAFDAGPQSGTTYRALADFADRFGHRLVGTDSLEAAIDHLVSALRAAGVDRVETEPVATPVWLRGKERATLVEPRRVPLAVLGLGGSVATPPGGLEAPVLVVRSFDELDARRDQVNGTIVLFNPEWTDYWQYVPYRSKGPSRAARYGAVATLVRSAAPASLYTLHTGMLAYTPGEPKVPAAAVTIEDADFLTRLVERGSKVVVHLEMNNNHTDGVSRNIVADITGSEFPDQYVIVGAHTDSWDVGQGVVDDAGGVFIGLAAMAQLRRMHLRPRRTLRLVLWTAEENGLWGGAEFVRQHRREMDAVSLAIESDQGTFAPVGLTTGGGSNTTVCILRHLLALTAPIGATRLEADRGRGSDVTKMAELGVPVSLLLNRNERYFHYHHSPADTVSAYSRRDLDLCAAFLTAIAFVVADLRDMLPRA
ncbi:carboxypeptidase Q-like [Amblyomma americanum]